MELGQLGDPGEAAQQPVVVVNTREQGPALTLGHRMVD